CTGPEMSIVRSFPGRYATFMAGNRLDSVKGRSLMSKQINKFTAVALGAAGAGAALALTNKHRQENAKRENLRSGGTAEYRNTERGKSEKNSKGIRYTAGNYEAFVRPEKPEGVEEKHAYIVGSGLAALAAACF